MCVCVRLYWDAVGKEDISYHLIYHFDFLPFSSSLACPGRFKDTGVVWFLILSDMLSIFSLHVVFHYPHYHNIYYARCILLAFSIKQARMLSWDSDLKSSATAVTQQQQGQGLRQPFANSKSAQAVCYKLLNLPRHMQIVKANV